MRGKGNADMQAVRGPQTGYMHPQDAKDYPLQQRKNQMYTFLFSIRIMCEEWILQMF